MPIKRDIIYPVFLKTIQYTEDIFWKDTFENLSYSICPNGSYISKGFLCSSVKGNEFVYKFGENIFITTKDPLNYQRKKFEFVYKIKNHPVS